MTDYYRIQQTDFCRRCIDRQIALMLDIVSAIENAENHEDVKRRLRELQCERLRQQDELDKLNG